MKRFHRQRRRSPRAAATSRLKDQAGVTLIETVVATGLLLVALAGLVSVSFVATTSTENQGHLSARTTEYAQDKMEQLLALAYGVDDAGAIEPIGADYSRYGGPVFGAD